MAKSMTSKFRVPVFKFQASHFLCELWANYLPTLSLNKSHTYHPGSGGIKCSRFSLKHKGHSQQLLLLNDHLCNKIYCRK